MNNHLSTIEKDRFLLVVIQVVFLVVISAVTASNSVLDNRASIQFSLYKKNLSTMGSIVQ